MSKEQEIREAVDLGMNMSRASSRALLNNGQWRKIREAIVVELMRLEPSVSVRKEPGPMLAPLDAAKDAAKGHIAQSGELVEIAVAQGQLDLMRAEEMYWYAKTDRINAKS